MATDQAKIKDDTIRWFKAFSDRDVNQLDKLADEIFDTTFILHSPNFPNVERGPNGMKKFIRGIFEDTSAVRTFTVDDMLGEGNKLAIRFTVHRTNASNGKVTQSPVILIAHYAGDKIVEEWQLAGPHEEA